MKNALIALLLIFTANTYGQTWVQVPDPNFQAFLAANYPAAALMTSGSDFFIDADHPDVQNCLTLNISNLDITDLSGILAFQNLQMLDCSNNNISDLAVLPGTLLTLKCPNNQLTSLPDLNFINWLDCSNNQLTQLPTLPSLFFCLICSGNQLSELPELPSSIMNLYCSHNQLTALPAIVSTNLTILDATYNQLSEVLALPATLQRLQLSGNQLITLSELPAGLELLDCGYNQLTSLPDLPNELEDLWVFENQLTSLPVLPDSLLSILCRNNQLVDLPVLPDGLLSLICNNNQLISLPVLPNGMSTLICNDNQLTSLPDLPDSLVNLICNHNELTSVPLLPDLITLIQLDNNHLSVLPSLPPNLDNLGCVNNDLIALPDLPQSLRSLYCANNEIIILPELPDSLEILNAAGNQIYCFNEFPSSLAFVSIVDNPFTCLPNYIPAMDAVTLAYPLCIENDPVNNPNGCQSAMGIQGSVFDDVNNDCVDSALPLIYIPMLLNDNGGNLVTSSTNLVNGDYYFAAAQGDYQLEINTTALSPALEVSCPVNNENTATVTQAVPVVEGGDFGLVCSGFDLGVQSIVPYGLVFPGETHELQILAGDLTAQFQAFCAAGISGDVAISISGPGTVTFSGSPVISGNTATYSIADFGVAGANVFGASVLTDTTADFTDEFCVSVTVTTAASGDLNPSNDMYNYCYHVVNSYDPNIKETYPELVAPGFTDEFTYTIHFQNTGNAPAINIRLADELDENLDLTSLKIVDASSAYVLSVDADSRLMSIRFPNIMLADSASDPEGSIGFVQYRIKPNNGLTDGTIIENTANIYFDYNDPIVTNTTQNIVSSALGLNDFKQEDLKLYPNPAKNNVNLESEEQIEQIEFYNLNGAKVMTVKPNAKKTQVDVSALQNGVYIMKILSQSGTINKRLVINQ